MDIWFSTNIIAWPFSCHFIAFHTACILHNSCPKFARRLPYSRVNFDVIWKQNVRDTGMAEVRFHKVLLFSGWYLIPFGHGFALSWFVSLLVLSFQLSACGFILHAVGRMFVSLAPLHDSRTPEEVLPVGRAFPFWRVAESNDNIAIILTCRHMNKTEEQEDLTSALAASPKRNPYSQHRRVHRSEPHQKTNTEK